MKKRDETGDTLYVLPFLLVCGFFVWFGWEELGPGPFGVVWTATAGAFTLYAAFHMLLAQKPGRASGGEQARIAPEGTETADRPADGTSPSGEPGAAEAVEPETAFTPYSPETDSLMEDVDRILGKEGMEAAKLVRVTQSAEQRARLGELAALYELRSIDAEEYQRRRREILEEA